MTRSLEEIKRLTDAREKAVRMYFIDGEKNIAKIAKDVKTSRQNVYSWIKAEEEARKKRK